MENIFDSDTLRLEILTIQRKEDGEYTLEAIMTDGSKDLKIELPRLMKPAMWVDSEIARIYTFKLEQTLLVTKEGVWGKLTEIKKEGGG